jgi:hypothetical protein
VKRGFDSVTSHPEWILDHFTCKALVIPVMFVMPTANKKHCGKRSQQNGLSFHLYGVIA